MKKKESIFVTKSSLPPKEEYMQMLEVIWESRWLTNMGQFHQMLERELSHYLDTPELVLCVNGHLALELILQAMEIKGEVITTPFTFVSTTHAIVRNGLTPVFCDISPEDFTMDPAKIEALITEKTSAIMPVHVYGHPCQVEEIQRIAHKHHLKVIYDAAHTFGERYMGQSLANFGDASMYSFHATKVFHTIEGGAVALKDPALRRALDYLKNFGISDKENVPFVGSNAKMNEFCAAMGLCNLRHINEYIENRKQVALRYEKNLKSTPGLSLPPRRREVEYNYAYFPVVFDTPASRDRVYEELGKEEIYTRKYFYPCTNALACYQGRFDPEKTPVARDISQRVLTLPIYPDLPLEEADRICEGIERILGRS